MASFMLIAMHIGQEVSHFTLFPHSQTPSHQGIEGVKFPICLVLVTFKHLRLLLCQQTG
jgi:hypothetical protein